MKTPEQIFDEALQARGIDRIGLQEAEVYEAGLDAIKQALSISNVVGQSEQLKALCENINPLLEANVKPFTIEELRDIIKVFYTV